MADGRWVVSLDDDLQAGLWNGRAEALAIWRRIATGLSFFEHHREWRVLVPVGPLGIIQDLASPNRVISRENLNLITRRRIPYRVIDRARLARAPLEGLHAVVATDLAPPTGVERELLAVFVENGGLLVTGPSWNGATPSRTGYVLKLKLPDRTKRLRPILPLKRARSPRRKLFADGCAFPRTRHREGPQVTSVTVTGPTDLPLSC